MPDKTYLPPPLTHRELARRSAIRADGKPKRATASLLDISLDGVRDPRLVRKDGRLRVVASVDGNGIRPERRYQRIPVTRLKAKNLDPQLLAQEIRGYRPSGIATTFAPKLSKPTHQLRVGRGKGVSIAAVQSSATTIAICSTTTRSRGGRPAKSGPSGSGGLGRRSVLVTS